MTEIDGSVGAVTYKFTQKISTPAGTPGLISTLYLSEAEYAALLPIPAATLRKIRSSFPPFGVDVFEGPLLGLVLAEIEFENAEDEAAFQPPAEAVAEVTTKVRFTGGRLVTMSADQTAELLAESGIRA